MASPLSIHWLGTWNGAKISAVSPRLQPWDTNKNVLANLSIMAMQWVGRMRTETQDPVAIHRVPCEMQDEATRLYARRKPGPLAPYPARVAAPIVSRKLAAKGFRGDGPLQMTRGSKKHRLMDLRSSNRPRLHAMADRR